MSTWQPVPADEAADLLGMFSARGQGRVRDLALHTVDVTVSPTLEEAPDAAVRDVTVAVTDARHGSWRVLLRDVQVHDAVGWDDDEVAWSVAARALESGTWETHDSAACHYGDGRKVHGRADGDWRTLRQRAVDHLAGDPSGTLYAYGRGSRATLRFAACQLHREMLDRVPGSCVACGGTRFRLQTLAALDVHLSPDADGAVRYVADADTLKELAAGTTLRAAFSKLICSGCGVSHGDDGLGRLDGVRFGGAGVELSAWETTPLSALLADGH